MFAMRSALISEDGQNRVSQNTVANRSPIMKPSLDFII